ncbi:MFS transporter [Actinomyces bowdenii]|uniref:MFS transporter n=1 Tax=Actinomyces bowdenii TaxID=131109 RepID=A0A853ELX7_9ACTO|nr:MFS transporter [Actinomyces bowdenii]MBF0698076.1 MFS transporter [Actinomyces bowdenii]NYS70249.1 MFS transporter [Actinomyces bowdenii]
MADHGLSMYTSLLRIPHAARSAVFGVVGQLPFPLLGMGLLIGIRDSYHSYTLAGVVSGVMALTSAITAPVVGRLVDAHGQRRVGLPVALLWIAAIALMSTALALHLPPWAIVACGVLLGTSVPFSSMLRARWTHVLRTQPGRLNSALSLTSTLEELMWVIGNPLATTLAVSVALLSPFAGAMAAIALAIWGFLLDSSIEPPAAGRRGRGDAAGAGQRAGDGAAARPAAGASLLSPGFLGLMVILVAYGAFIAALNLSVVAMTKEIGRPGASGMIIACFSAASMVGALGYGARTWASSLMRRFYAGLTVVALASAALPLSGGVWMTAGILMVAGLAHAPTVVNVNQLLIRMTPPQRLTEAMALLGSMFVVGMAVSNLVTGRVVDAWGAQAGFVTLSAFAVTGLVIGLAAMAPIRTAASQPVLRADDGAPEPLP